jgi:ABC-type multidrug transport system fused ATPase/permease subunit
MTTKFTEEYLKDYKEQIRKLPLDELYEVLDIISKDDSPERQNIVKARIEELENKEEIESYFAPSATFSEQFQDETERSIEQTFEPYPSLNDDQISIPGSDQADTESDDSSNHKITQEEIDKYNNTQPVPDTNGLISFIFLMAIGFGIILFALIMGSIGANKSAGFHDFKITTVLPFLKYIPIATILFFYKQTHKDIVRDYWLNHLKLALSIASFLAVNAVITFITGTYSGIYRSCSGRPAYMIAAGVLFFSITFIVNAFLPISQRYRPKNGLTLAALALVLETALR